MKRRILTLCAAAILIFTLSPTAALAAGEMGVTDSFTWEVLPGNTAVTITGYTSIPLGDLVMPDTVDASAWGYGTLPVTQILSGAFQNETAVSSIDLPDNLQVIGNYAFSNCTGLEDISLPGTLTTIGQYAFQYCANPSLTSITVPDSVSSIGNGAFGYCTNLSSVVLPANPAFTAIPASLFLSCYYLTSVTIPGNVTYIGDDAFSNTGFTTFMMPRNVTSFSYSAFFDCDSLTSFTVEAGSTSFIADDGILYSFDHTTLAKYPPARSGSFTVPAGVTDIGEYAFSECNNLTGITLDGVDHIHQAAFSYCTGLTTLAIPSTVTIMDPGAFAFCTGLTSVSLPAGIGAISEAAFYACIGLESITIPSGITAVGDEAFCYCVALAGISIPESVVSIGESAFTYCNSLTSVTIPSGAIGINAFSECGTLTSVTFLEGVTSVGDGAFHLCPDLSRAVVQSGLTTFGADVFTDTDLGSDGIYGRGGSIAQTYASSNSIPFTLLLELSMSPADGNIITGGNATITPNVAGGVWAFDAGLLSRSGNDFTGLAAGTAHITYTAGWQSESADVNITEALALTMSPADGRIYTGGRVTITPNLAGGTWSFDSGLLSRSGNEFTGLAAGTAHVTYTAGSQSDSADVEISDSGLPSTGQDAALIYLLCGMALLALGAGAAAGMLSRRRKKRA